MIYIVTPDVAHRPEQRGDKYEVAALRSRVDRDDTVLRGERRNVAGVEQGAGGSSQAG